MPPTHTPTSDTLCLECGQAQWTPLLCEPCGTLRPNHIQTNVFARLGLETIYDIDIDLAEKNYRRLSRLVHPDYFAADKTMQRQASQLSILVNEAWKILQNPWLRAERLLTILCGQFTLDTKNIPQELLLEILDTRETLENPTLSGKQLKQILDTYTTRLENLKTALTQHFQTIHNENTLQHAQAVQDLLNQRKYYQNIIETAQELSLGAS